MDNRKERGAAKKAVRWERQAAARMGAADRSQRLKQRILSAAREDNVGESQVPRIPTPKVSAPETDWMPLQALAGLVTTAFPAYIVAEATINDRLHPLHWLVALAGGLLGYIAGLLIYRRRGY